MQNRIFFCEFIIFGKFKMEDSVCTFLSTSVKKYSKNTSFQYLRVQLPIRLEKQLKSLKVLGSSCGKRPDSNWRQGQTGGVKFVQSPREAGEKAAELIGSYVGNFKVKRVIE